MALFVKWQVSFTGVVMVALLQAKCSVTTAQQDGADINSFAIDHLEPSGPRLTFDQANLTDVSRLTSDQGNTTYDPRLTYQVHSDSSNTATQDLPVNASLSPATTIQNLPTTKYSTGSVAPDEGDGPKPLHDCLQVTHDDIRKVYGFPNHTYYLIWFQPLRAGAPISIEFDYKVYNEDYSFYPFGKPYYVEGRPYEWHRLQVVTGDDANASCGQTSIGAMSELKISNIGFQQCLPHKTISGIRVSSNENVVMWSICPPKDQWWSNMHEVCLSASKSDNTSSSSSTVTALAVFIAIAVALLVFSGIYIWQLRKQLDQGKTVTGDDESVYEEWNESLNNTAITLTPPSSVSYRSTPNGTLNTELS